MNEERDADLARRLAELEVPAHAPGFWEGVRAGLEDGRVVELAEHRRRRTTPLALLVAATVLVALLTTGLVLALDDDEADVATEPTTVTTAPTPTDPSTTAAPEPGVGAGSLHAAGPPVARGSGEVVAVDPSGRFLYVAAPAPGGGQGCEGAERRALYVEPVEASGDRQLVAPVDLVDATSSLKIEFSTAGEVAIVATCEGFGAGIVTGTLGPDGTLTDPVQLGLPGVESILDIDFLAPGMLVAATYAPGAEGDDGSEGSAQRVYQFPVGPSESTDLGIDGVARLAVLPDGRLATVETEGAVRVGQDLLGSAPYAIDLQVTSDGRWAMVQTTEGVVRFATSADDRDEQRLATEGATVRMDVTRTGSVLAEELAGDDQHLRVAELDPATGRRLGTVFDTERPGRGFVITPSEDRLFVSVVRPDRPGDLVVLEVPLTR